MKQSMRPRLLYLAVAAALFTLSMCFSGVNISAREIILGVGLDYDAEKECYGLSVEAVSPGGGSNQQTGTFIKLLTASGDTVEDAFSALAAQTGMLPSLGQCQILFLGESLYKNIGVREVASYFSAVEAFKDSADVCCLAGNCEQLFRTQMPMQKSVSLAVSQLLGKGASSGTVQHTINEFVKEQITQTDSACATLVEPVLQENVTEGGGSDGEKQQSATYDCVRQVVFRDFSYVTTLTKEQSVGYALLKQGAKGQIFTVESETDGYEAAKTSVGVSGKKIKTSCEKQDGYKYGLQVDLAVKNVRTGSVEEGGALYPKKQPQLSENALRQTEKQAERNIASFLAEQKRLDFDVIGMFRDFHVRFRAEWTDAAKKLTVSDIEVSVAVNVAEDA